MRLGIAGLLPAALDGFDTDVVRRVREYGFTGAAWSPRLPVSEFPMARAREIGRMLSDGDVVLVEFGQYHTCLVHADESVRLQHVESVRGALRLARAMGCPAVIIGAGSLHPDSQWFPYPGNHSPRVRERVVNALRRIVPVAEDEGVVLGLECHTNTAFKDAATVRAIMEEVGSNVLRVHLDPVNWMTPETVYESGTAINAMFDVLGARIYGAHSKGVVVEDKLIIHLSETYTGAKGDLLDHGTFLRRLAALSGNPFLVIEHIPVNAVPAARDYLLRIASTIGVSFT